MNSENGIGATNSSSSRKSEKPRYCRFTQQELPACKPILTPALIMSTFIVLGVTLIPIGLCHLSASDDVVEIVERYDDGCIPAGIQHLDEANGKRVAFIQDDKTDKKCIRNITVPKMMKSPIFVYYQLYNFYQNHRRYVKSKNEAQYRFPSAAHSTANCEPEAESNGQPIVPCGLIAWSLFNDTYKLSVHGVALPINKKGIAWESDRIHKFSSDVYPKNFQKKSPIGGAQLDESIPLNQQEDLMVWMRTAALPTFRKLYGRIDSDLQPNDMIQVEIQNNYNTYTFNGRKELVMSTTTWVGGKNDFLGKSYIFTGGACLLVAIAYIILYLIRPRPLGDPAYLSWNINAAPIG